MNEKEKNDSAPDKCTESTTDNITEEEIRSKREAAKPREDESVQSGEIVIHSTFLSWLDNFWYHNKWKVIAVVFVAICAIVILLQFLNRTNYDGYIFYAGSRSIDRTSADTTPEYQQMLNSLEKVVDDMDGNGKIDIAYETLFALSPEEQKEVEESEGYEVSYSLLQNDMKTLENRMLYDKYYVCLISEYVYELYTEDDGSNLFIPLGEYMPDGAKYDYYDETDDAIYLSSTGFGDLGGFRNLPDDTLICLRRPIGSTDSDKYFHAAEDMMRNILAYGLRKD